MVSDKNSQKEPLRKRKTPSRKRKGRMEEVWTPRLAAEGFTQVSNFFLDRFHDFGLRLVHEADVGNVNHVRQQHADRHLKCASGTQGRTAKGKDSK